MLKQSTAVDILIGPFVDDTDGVTAETGLTIAQADVQLSKNGQTMAQKNDATACSHDANGYYNCELDTTDTNTLGQLTVTVNESGALPVRLDFQVVTANWFDTMCSTDQLDVNVTNIEGSDATDQIRDAVVDDATRLDGSALNGLAGNDPGSTIAAATDISGLNDPTAASIADAVWDEALSGHTGAGSAGEAQNRLDDIQTDTEDLQTQIGTAGAGLTGVPWNSAWDAEVQSECTDALNAYDPPTEAEMTSGFSALNDISVANILAGTVDTGEDIESAIKQILAYANGNISKSSNAYTYNDRDGSGLFTNTVSTTARSRS